MSGRRGGMLPFRRQGNWMKSNLSVALKSFLSVGFPLYRHSVAIKAFRIGTILHKSFMPAGFLIIDQIIIHVNFRKCFPSQKVYLAERINRAINRNESWLIWTRKENRLPCWYVLEMPMIGILS